jgi:hypothetical protein
MISYFKSQTVHTFPFSDMREREQPTYLKCNCEGGEWSLKPMDFRGINTIEIQFHYSTEFKDNPDLLSWLRKNYTTSESTTLTKGVNGIYKILDLHGKR